METRDAALSRHSTGTLSRWIHMGKVSDRLLHTEKIGAHDFESEKCGS